MSTPRPLHTLLKGRFPRVVSGASSSASTAFVVRDPNTLFFEYGIGHGKPDHVLAQHVLQFFAKPVPFVLRSPDEFFLYHKLASKDTLAGLAVKYNVQLTDIKRANLIDTENGLYALHVPQKPH
eukprot:jgi/Pico_ML_1/54396/g4750.t2